RQPPEEIPGTYSGRLCRPLDRPGIGARENPGSRLMDIAVLAEPDELDQGAMVHDHGGPDAFRRRPGRTDDFLALESSLEVVDFEGHMGPGLDELGRGAGLLEPTPLHAVRAGTETRHVETILSEMNLSWVLDVGWNTDVMIAPATLRDRRWGLMAESAVRRWVLGVRHWGGSHGGLFRFPRTGLFHVSA